jgi:hypothetical protein
MRASKIKPFLFLFVLLFGHAYNLFAQHYIFIEAEKQQPFYLKKNGETYSSTGKGFIILSKLNTTDIDFVIGFPNNLFPEVTFKVSGVVSDRGFFLKRAEGKGWVLLDRYSSELISSGQVAVKATNTLTSSTTGFAELLVDATGDKTLLDRSSLVNVPTVKQATDNVKTKTTSTVAKSQAASKQINKPTGLGTIRSYIQSDDSLALKITYFEKGAKDNWDTIYVEIEKIVERTSSSPSVKMDLNNGAVVNSAPQKKESMNVIAAAESELNLPADCVNPIALPKDIRELQRRISRASSFDAQIDIAIKTLSEKCFTTKQVKELGTSFWDEQNRLIFFTRARKWVVDPALYGELEQSFLQEGSVNAFREMMKKQSQ